MSSDPISREVSPADRPEDLAGTVAADEMLAALAAARRRLERGEAVDLAPLQTVLTKTLAASSRSRVPQAVRLALVDEATRLVEAARLARDSAEAELRRLDHGTRAVRAYRVSGSGEPP